MAAIPGLAIFPDRHALMAAAADAIADALGHALAAQGSACAALSGGTTPGPAYSLLAGKPLNWPKITFLLVDERCVPLEHPASNEAMLRRELAPALAQGARLLPMYSPAGAPADAAAAADGTYVGAHIDIAVMGMGADAHTASWFPGATGLAEALDPAGARAVVPIHAPGAFGSPDRLTLTGAAIARAGAVLLLITGAEKRAALERAFDSDPTAAPVTALFRTGQRPIVYWAA